MRVFFIKVWYSECNERFSYFRFGRLFDNRISPLWAFPFGLRGDCVLFCVGILEGGLVKSCFGIPAFLSSF